EEGGKRDRGCDDTRRPFPGDRAGGGHHDRRRDAADYHELQPDAFHTTSRNRSRSSDSAATAAALSSGPIGWWPNLARSYSSVSVAATAVGAPYSRNTRSRYSNGVSHGARGRPVLPRKASIP